MPSYQTFKIDEINLSEEKDSYYFHQNNQEVEIKLNKGFSISKDLLNFIGNTLQENESFEIKIVYKNELLNYFIILDKKYSENFSNNSIKNCEIHKYDKHLNIEGLESKLYGSVSPFVLNNRETNFIDELAECFPKQDFSICIKSSLCSKKKNEYLEDLNTVIKKLSKKSEVTKSTGGGFLITGSSSKTAKNISIIEQLNKLENHYRNIVSNIALFSIPEITLKAENGTILSNIYSTLKSFSKRSGGLFLNSLFQLDKKNDEKIGDKTENTNNEFYGNFIELIGDINEYPVESCYDLFAEKGLVSSNDIASMISLPTSEIPGIKVTKRIDFGSDVSENLEEKDNLKLGLLFKNHQTNLQVLFPNNDLTKHTFVTGVTGSGKTSTIKHILMGNYKKGIPFIVFEPAKREYKYLENKIKDLKIFKLGIEGQNKLTINPFSFPEKIHVQTHLDHLKSVFFAAFPLYGPMPYILEKAFYNIYKRTDWDLVSSRNIFEKKLVRDDLFPTLEDLYIAIQEVTDEVGYSKEVQSDIKGALKVRIGSLMTGAKGSMLNTRESYPIEELLNHPSVIEMEHIGDNDEKIFLMGLLLIRIYEYYISKGTYTNSLKNILVVEEAHRLLQNVGATNNLEIADIKGKAIETFNNILSEVRAYGQGIIIADQIPSKLSPDVVKNTNLKIIHRLFAEDDRQSVGKSIGLDDDQIKELIRLKQGEAVIFHSKIDSAVKIKVKVDKDILAQEQLSDEDEKQIINPTKYVIQDDYFKKEAKKLINTYILFLALKDNIYKKLVEILKNKFSNSGLSFNKYDIIKGLLEIVIKALRSRKPLSLNYNEEIELIKKVKSSKSPLTDFGKQLEKYENNYSRSEGKLSPLYKKYCIFRDLNGLKDNLNNIFIKHKNDFIQGNEILVDEILETTSISNYINLSLLTKENKKQLADSIVISAFPNNIEILNYYFSIKDFSLDMNLKGKSDKDTNASKSPLQDKIIEKFYESQDKLSNNLENMNSILKSHLERYKQNPITQLKLWHKILLFSSIGINIFILLYLLKVF